MHTADGEVTNLLRELKGLDTEGQSAEDRLFVVVYDSLRRIAARHLRDERHDHTLQPTALVHEAYIRLVAQSEQNWQNRFQFFAFAARIMRQILVDHARRRDALKRGGRERDLTLDETILPGVTKSRDLIALDEALTRLKEFDARQSQIVELRFFAGFSEEEVADVLGVSARTIKRDWRIARAWLYSELNR
jgi:RNA polymerase sigma factor (TIGR02999 family)